ncbi:cytochrome C assembly family protein [Bacillus marinisedimentorum]|uniref:cytochrome C assembly family protein n=1 Tax=Bacillus marinisedimentorum TaxID=1821260 RepID=UPI000872759F|nr:cytochrome c biogenesis protein [Bacillus marinisedimentorum]
MSSMNINVIYELMILLYSLSVLLYFIDFIQNNRKVNRTAFWLLSIVWILQTVFLVVRMLETNRFPILTLLEGLYFYAWVLVTFSLVINRLFRMDFFVFFTNVLGFSFMTLHLLAPNQHFADTSAERLMSELAVIHITIAILSYGAFSISFILSIMYLLQYNMLKQKQWGKRLQRLGDLSTFEKMAFRFNLIGVPLLLISLILGVIWANAKVEQFYLYDAKVIGSFIVLAVYSFILYMKAGKGIQGKQMVTWNFAAFLIVLINFFLFGSLSNFHIWYP